MTYPLVSIVTICKNAEALIESTMMSVLNQGYPFIEYIIIDGKSDDRTVSIAEDLAESLSAKRTHIVSERDQGISEAMNKGVLLAKGDLITHLHAGDRYIDDSIIEKVVNSFLKESWRWGVAGAIIVDSFGKRKHRTVPVSKICSLLKKNSIPHQSTFLVKDIFDKHGLFRTDLTQAMDYEFWLRIAFKGNETYTVLPFDSTYFLEGGRSSNIPQLLWHSYRLRKELHEYECKTNMFLDAVFLIRIFLFSIFYKAKSLMSSGCIVNRNQVDE
jgi:glycosyltransferase involved in cell wall biosynthesis